MVIINTLRQKRDGKTLTISGKKQEITVSNGVASASSGMADANSNAAKLIHKPYRM